MAKHKQLRDVYRFPGFSPQHRISGIFGDPRALLIPLNRRGKKQFAEPAGRSIARSTTERSEGFAICPVGICGFTWTWRCAASFAAGAGR